MRADDWTAALDEAASAPPTKREPKRRPREEPPTEAELEAFAEGLARCTPCLYAALFVLFIPTRWTAPLFVAQVTPAASPVPIGLN